MVDLGAHVPLDVSVKEFRVLKREIFGTDALAMNKILVAGQQILKGGGMRIAVQFLFGRMLHRGGEGVVRRREGGAVLGPRGEADVGKAKVPLLCEGDCGLRALLRMVKEAHEVVRLAPLPAGVSHLGEAGVLGLTAQIAQLGENLAGGGEAVLDLAFDGKAQLAHSEDDLQPRHHEPGTDENAPTNVRAGQEIAAQVGRRQQRKPAKLLNEAVFKAAAGDGEHDRCRDVKDLLESGFHDGRRVVCEVPRLKDNLPRINPASCSPAVPPSPVISHEFFVREVAMPMCHVSI